MSSTREKVKVLFELYYKNLCYFAYTLIGDKNLAEDFVQDAFIALYKNYGTVVQEEKVLKSFLYSSVRNSIYNWHRRNNIERKYHEKEPFNELVEIDFDNALIKVEALSQINAMINQLPDACQQIFRMHYLEEMSLKEIAETLQVSINTVKTQKLRGLRFLKSKLNPELFFFLLWIYLSK